MGMLASLEAVIIVRLMVLEDFTLKQTLEGGRRLSELKEGMLESRNWRELIPDLGRGNILSCGNCQQISKSLPGMMITSPLAISRLSSLIASDPKPESPIPVVEFEKATPNLNHSKLDDDEVEHKLNWFYWLRRPLQRGLHRRDFPSL